MGCFRSVLENTEQNTFCFGFLMRKIGENRWQKHFGNIWSSSMYHRVSVEHFEIWHVRATVSFVSYWSLFMCIHDNGNIIPIFSGELGRFCCKCVSVWACVLVGFGDWKRLWFYRLYFVSLYFCGYFRCHFHNRSCGRHNFYRQFLVRCLVGNLSVWKQEKGQQKPTEFRVNIIEKSHTLSIM